MNIDEMLSGLIHRLHPNMSMPDGTREKWRLYRALVTTRMPGAIQDDFLRLQDELLQAVLLRRGIVKAEALDSSPLDVRLSLWRGDITRLSADAIVNTANKQLLGCFIPGHGCIDNAIHTYAGVRLREACHALMEEQGHDEPVGRAKMTPGYNLPSRFVLHTVGPTVGEMPTGEDRDGLASCYESCLAAAGECGLQSIAFCCISTGVFCFPKPEAAQIAIHTVRAYLNAHPTSIQRVVFNVYEEEDDCIYRELLGFDKEP